MPYNPILGMGYETLNLGGLGQGEDTYTGNVPNPQQDLTVTLSNARTFVSHAIVTISINNAVAYGGEVNAFLRVGEDLVAKYVIPTGQAGQVVNETVPIGKIFYNPTNAVLTHGGVAAGGAANYTVKIVVYSRPA